MNDCVFLCNITVILGTRQQRKDGKNSTHEEHHVSCNLKLMDRGGNTELKFNFYVLSLSVSMFTPLHFIVFSAPLHSSDSFYEMKIWQIKLAVSKLTSESFVVSSQFRYL